MTPLADSLEFVGVSELSAVIQEILAMHVRVCVRMCVCERARACECACEYVHACVYMCVHSLHGGVHACGDQRLTLAVFLNGFQLIF